jgi:hypothetical protein
MKLMNLAATIYLSMMTVNKALMLKVDSKENILLQENSMASVKWRSSVSNSITTWMTSANTANTAMSQNVSQMLANP